MRSTVLLTLFGSIGNTMANAVSFSQPPSPLADLTNQASGAYHISSKALRRTLSTRALYRRLDTSESIPSSHESICDADVVRSDEDHAEKMPTPANASPASTIHPRADLPPLPPLELLDQLSDLPTQSQRSIRSDASVPKPRPRTMYHQPTRLEPIIEQRSYVSLASLSQARLGQSPARHINVVHPQQSHHSLHPSHRKKSPWPLEKPLPAPSYYNRRAFSMDDLVCWDVSSLDCHISKTGSSDSSSSDAGLFVRLNEKCSQLAEPRRPSHPSLQRKPTPPGIPSFGTPEAMNYFARPRARSSSWFRIARSASPRPAPPAASASTSTSTAAGAVAANRNPPGLEPSRLSRCLSLLENNIMQAFSNSSPRRASLPEGVLRADDGTFVRGRFGGRVSGHGVGSRGLDAHPMQRAAARERKNDAGLDMLPRQRPVPAPQIQVQDPEPPVSGAAESSNVLLRHPSFSSLLTRWFTGEHWWRQQGQEPQDPEPRPIVDVAADMRDFAIRNGPSHPAAAAAAPTPTPPPQQALEPENRYYTSAETSSTPNPDRHRDDGRNTDTDTPPPPETDEESRCTALYWSCLRCFCMSFCGASKRELDGEAWYGDDRCWIRKRRDRQERASRGARLRRGEEEREMSDRQRGQREVSWDSVSELRRSTGLGLGSQMMREGGVGRERQGEMRYRAGGSQGG